jgi:hypothetical protein
MLSEKIINKINHLISKRNFKFKGKIINDLPESMISDIDYTFKISGYKKMMSVGEYYDYTLIDVIITGLNDKFSQLLFTPEDNEQGKIIAKSFEYGLYKFYSDLNLEITNYLRIFDINIRTTINELKFDLKEPITESKMSRMSRIAVRTTVKDIVNIIKDCKEGTFYLPGEDGEEYSFTNLPFTYSVNLVTKIDKNLDGYEVDGYYSSDNDVVEIFVRFNPKNLKKHFYNIIGQLNDVVAHELEHGFQYVTEGKVFKKPPTKSFKYYTQPDEVKSQRVGLRRLAKLTNSPFSNVVTEWFDTHRDVHKLTLNEEQKVIKIILDNK